MSPLSKKDLAADLLYGKLPGHLVTDEQPVGRHAGI